MKFLNKKNIVIGAIILILTIVCIMVGNWIDDSAYALENSEDIIEYGSQDEETNAATSSGANNIPKAEDKLQNDEEEDIFNGEGTSEQGKADESSDGEETNAKENEIEENSNQNNEDIKMIFKQASSQKIYVYITGEVNNPGVVALNEGSRIVDAIEAAGGVTGNANISKVNLVYCLLDGMKVNIPSDNDLKKNSDFEYITMSSGDNKSDENITGVITGTNKGKTTNSSNGFEGNVSAFKQSIVNINTATQTELETLPGIGPSIALNIINYRKENGKFANVEDIKNVSGIGNSKFDNIKNFIVI